MTEQECQNLLAWLTQREHLSRKGIHLVVKEGIHRGHAYYGSGLLTVPKWATNNQFEGTTYVIHEFSHFVNFYKGTDMDTHGKSFKRIENRLLKLFGLRIDRYRAYEKKIYYNEELVITK